MKSRLILAGATLALTGAVAVAQSTAKPSPYEGTSQPPTSDVIHATRIAGHCARQLPAGSSSAGRRSREAGAVNEHASGAGRKSRLWHRRSARSPPRRALRR